MEKLKQYTKQLQELSKQMIKDEIEFKVDNKGSIVLLKENLLAIDTCIKIKAIRL